MVVAFVVEAQTHEENQAGFMQIHGCQCRSCFFVFFLMALCPKMKGESRSKGEVKIYLHLTKHRIQSIYIGGL